MPDRCPDELAVEVKEREIEPSDAHVDAVQAVEEDRETKHLDPSDAIGTEGSDADFAEETLPPATAHATDNPVPIAPLCEHPTYEMEARSRLLAIRRLRDEPANSLLTQRECVSGIFRDE